MATYRDPSGNAAPEAPAVRTVHRDARGVWWVRIGQRNHRVALHRTEDGIGTSCWTALRTGGKSTGCANS